MDKMDRGLEEWRIRGLNLVWGLREDFNFLNFKKFLEKEKKQKNLENPKYGG